MRLLPVLFLLAAGCAGDPLDRAFGPGGRTIREEIGTWPAESQAAFAKVRDRCSACHTLHPIFAAHVPAGNWASVVRKMARRPGAAIPDGEQPAIAEWLEFYSDRRRGVDAK